jgi:hypothetical protein
LAIIKIQRLTLLGVVINHQGLSLECARFVPSCFGRRPLSGATSAGKIETAVIDQVRVLIRTPEIVVRTWRAAKVEDAVISENDVLEALQRLDPVWEELFPAEQARILQLLVERVDVSLDGIHIRLRTDGLTSLVADLRGRDLERMAAA